jgi:hypothetical protein
MQIGRVTGVEIGPNRDGEGNVRLLTVEITDPDDVQTVEQFRIPGDDSAPPIDSTVLVERVGEAWAIGVGFDDNVEPDADPGEKILYSSQGGTIKAKVHLFTDGKIRIENTTGLPSPGYIEMNATTGQVDINGNFTVDV